jgi:hypothetical protein
MLGAVYGESVLAVVPSIVVAAPSFRDEELDLPLMSRIIAARWSVNR